MKIFIKPVSQNPPDKETFLPWLQKDVHPILGQVRDLLYWIASRFGMVKVDRGDSLGFVEDKLVAGPNVTITKTGTAGDRTLTIDADVGTGDLYIVKADDADTGPDSLVDKLKAGTNVSISAVTDGAVRKVQVNASTPLATSDPLPPGPADPGYGPNAAAEGHVHPPGDPAETGGVLYTGWNQDQYNLGIVDAMYRGYSVCAPSLWVGYTQTSDGVWTKDTHGDLSSYTVDGMTPFVGMKVLAYVPGLEAWEKPHAWLYTLTDTGATQTDPITHEIIYHYATFERISGTPLNGQSVFISGGTTYHGTTWYLDTADPIVLGLTELAWSEGAAYSSSDANVLVDASRLSLITAGFTKTSEVSVTSSADVELVTVQTPEGFPSAAIIPAGQWVFKTLAGVSADNPAATIQIKKVLRRFTTGGSHTTIGTATTPDFHSAIPLVQLATLDVSDETLATGERLEVVYYASTTSATPVTVWMAYSDAAHTTRIETTMGFGFVGTIDHHLLDNRHVFGDHTVDDLGPGILHTPWQASTATSAGLLSARERNRAIVSGSEDFIGIGTTGWSAGDELEILFAQARTVKHSATVGAGYAPITTPYIIGVGNDDEYVRAGSSAVFVLNSTATAWLMKGITHYA